MLIDGLPCGLCRSDTARSPMPFWSIKFVSPSSRIPALSSHFRRPSSFDWFLTIFYRLFFWFRLCFDRIFDRFWPTNIKYQVFNCLLADFFIVFLIIFLIDFFTIFHWFLHCFFIDFSTDLKSSRIRIVILSFQKRIYWSVTRYQMVTISWVPRSGPTTRKRKQTHRD